MEKSKVLSELKRKPEKAVLVYILNIKHHTEFSEVMHVLGEKLPWEETVAELGIIHFPLKNPGQGIQMLTYLQVQRVN